jgi:hypothetical protein
MALIFEIIQCAPSFHAASMKLPSFPLPAQKRKSFSASVLRLLNSAERNGFGSPVCWLDLKYLHEDGGSKIYSRHARIWSPQMGFGFDPSGRPPRKMELDDLMNAEYGTPLQIDDRSSIHLSGKRQAKPAYEEMAGRGVTALMAFDDPDEGSAVDRYLQHTRLTLSRYMEPGQFQHFPFYFPLLSSNAISSATEAQLREWMGNARLYIREAYDSQELLMLSTHQLHPVFEGAGLRPNALVAEDATVWQSQDEKESASWTI